MFCGNCGEKIKSGIRFCGKCGHKVEEQEVEIIEIEEKEKKIESLTSNGMIYVVVSLTMVLTFGIIIVCSLL